jgi:ribonucleoside-triphosphate reductase
LRGLVDTCPACESTDVVGETRVVGYFSKIQNWNKSKRYGELKARQRGQYAIETADACVEQAAVKVNG